MLGQVITNLVNFLCATKPHLPDDLLEVLSAQKDPASVLEFDSSTDGKWRQEVVRKLVDLNCATSALVFLNANCDRETFQMVIRAAAVNRQTYVLVRKAFDRMKGMGFRRAVQDFEVVMCKLCPPSDLYDLFLEMKKECEEGASPECYKLVLDNCTDYKKAFTVVREANSKGVWANVSGFVYKALKERAWPAVSRVRSAADLIKEGGNFDTVISEVLLRGGLDRNLAVEVFDKVAGMVSCQPYPKSCAALLALLRRHCFGLSVSETWPSVDDIPNILASFLMFKEIDEDTCVHIVCFLLQRDLYGEAAVIFKKFPQHFKGDNEKVDWIRRKMIKMKN